MQLCEPKVQRSDCSKHVKTVFFSTFGHIWCRQELMPPLWSSHSSPIHLLLKPFVFVGAASLRKGRGTGTQTSCLCSWHYDKPTVYTGWRKALTKHWGVHLTVHKGSPCGGFHLCVLAKLPLYCHQGFRICQQEAQQPKCSRTNITLETNKDSHEEEDDKVAHSGVA